MCAIAGILNLNAAPQTVQAMEKTMRRRGPDDFGIFQKGDVTLLHARLIKAAANKNLAFNQNDKAAQRKNRKEASK